MILSDIIYGLTQELRSLFNSFGAIGIIILDTEIKDDETYDLPLCIIEINDAPDSVRLPGNGLTQIDFDFTLRIYAYEPNAYIEQDGGYSASLLEIVDKIRNYFELECWQTPEMQMLLSKYGFRLTFSGITKAEPLSQNEKLIMGYRIGFNTIAFDQGTNSSFDENVTVGTVTTPGIIFE